jgi:hypothetical protein
MKFYILIICLAFVSCKKDLPVETSGLSADSLSQNTSIVDGVAANANQDSMIANSPAVEKVLKEGINRNVGKNEIIRTADGSMLPFTIGDQFTENDQTFILKLKNATNPKLKITIESKKTMNIRVKQIKYPDGTFDGPFEKSLVLKTPKKGEYWIILGKNQMDDGESKGHFSLKVE